MERGISISAGRLAIDPFRSYGGETMGEVAMPKGGKPKRKSALERLAERADVEPVSETPNSASENTAARPAKSEERPASLPETEPQGETQPAEVAANSGRLPNGQFAPGHKHGFKPGESGNPLGRPLKAQVGSSLKRLAKRPLNTRHRRQLATMLGVGVRSAEVKEATYADFLAMRALYEAAEGDLGWFKVAGLSQEEAKNAGIVKVEHGDTVITVGGAGVSETEGESARSAFHRVVLEGEALEEKDVTPERGEVPASASINSDE